MSSRGTGRTTTPLGGGRGRWRTYAAGGEQWMHAAGNLLCAGGEGNRWTPPGDLAAIGR
jgi:hypothetical protein